MIAPGRKRVVLYECVCASDERPHLLYMCICEDRDHLGHDEARELLEDKGRVRRYGKLVHCMHANVLLNLDEV